MIRDTRGGAASDESWDPEPEPEVYTASAHDDRPAPWETVKRGAAAAGFAAGVAFTGAQAYEEPTQNSLNTRGNYVDSTARNRRTNQARGHRQSTTYRGRQRGGSGQDG